MTDRPEGSPTFSSSGYEEFAVNGVIVMDLITKKDSNEFIRTMFVRKMERTKHMLKRIPVEIDTEGLEAYPDADVFE
jgi:KaiC/GvpD/RAD55 family RecA-like ATPase